MSNTIYWSPTGLTGGATADLDYIDGNDLVDGDFAHVEIDDVMYFFKLDDSSGATEDSPFIISPDSNAGNKRWILQHATGAIYNVSSTPITLARKHLRAGVTFTNNGATAAYQLNLPAIASSIYGAVLRVVNAHATYTITADAAGTDKIRCWDGVEYTDSIAGGKIRTYAQKGSSFTLVCLHDYWYCVGQVGDIYLETS